MDTKARAASWDSGQGAELSGGRWNPKGFATVYASVDPSTAVLEVAVHKGFDTLDRVAHVLTCAEILDPSHVHVVHRNDVPNANWLRPGTPGHAQQQFGQQMLLEHRFVAIPSAVCERSWNLVFHPMKATGCYRFIQSEAFSLDTRLNPPK